MNRFISISQGWRDGESPLLVILNVCWRTSVRTEPNSKFDNRCRHHKFYFIYLLVECIHHINQKTSDQSGLIDKFYVLFVLLIWIIRLLKWGRNLRDRPVSPTTDPLPPCLLIEAIVPKRVSKTSLSQNCPMNSVITFYSCGRIMWSCCRKLIYVSVKRYWLMSKLRTYKNFKYADSPSTERTRKKSCLNNFATLKNSNCNSRTRFKRTKT